MRRHRPLTTRTARAALVALVALVATSVLAGCGDDAEPTSGTSAEGAASPEGTASATEEPSATDEPSASGTDGEKEPEEEPAGPTLDVTVEGGVVKPNAEVVELEVGQPLTLRITSDRAGELHVHSTPEQYVDFGAGSKDAEIVVENPGTVDVEEHESGVLIAKLLVQ